MFNTTPVVLLTLGLVLTGCAATIDQTGLEQRTAQAIGRAPGQFTISDRTEETGGRINYTVQTHDRKTYRCYLYGATVFQRTMSFGQTPHSDAICTQTVQVQGSAASRNGTAQTAPPAQTDVKPCNALLRAAGRC